MNGRRNFLKVGMIGIFSFLVFVWNKLTLNHIELNKRKALTITIPQNKSVSFFDEYIFINNGEHKIVLNAHCTHLGCKINKTENDRLVCPCHGSEYDLKGKVIKGPAYKNLNEVSFKISSDGTQIEINS